MVARVCRVEVWMVTGSAGWGVDGCRGLQGGDMADCWGLPGGVWMEEKVEGRSKDAVSCGGMESSRGGPKCGLQSHERLTNDLYFLHCRDKTHCHTHHELSRVTFLNCSVHSLHNCRAVAPPSRFLRVSPLTCPFLTCI